MNAEELGIVLEELLFRVLQGNKTVKPSRAVTKVYDTIT